jgi:uncharacterized oxidoreductase
MKMTGNTILITGGAAGIGRGLAEAFHRLGNQVIISGRRAGALDEVTAANPGMASLPLDIMDPASIATFAQHAIARYPDLNVLINNAGIMRMEDVKGSPSAVATAEDEVTTNLLGTIRTSAAILPHLLEKADGTLITVSSGLAFVPVTAAPAYCATKAAIHSWSISMRDQLKDTSVAVVEIAPPYVQTELLGPQQASDPHAMPLEDFIRETLALLERGDDEVIVDYCKPLRFAEADGKFVEMLGMLNAAGNSGL